MKKSLNPLAVAGIIVAVLAFIGLVLFRMTSQPTPLPPVATSPDGTAQPKPKFRP